MAQVQYQLIISATDGSSWETGWMNADPLKRGSIPGVLWSYAQHPESLYVEWLHNSPTEGRTCKLYRRELIPTDPEEVSFP